MKTAAGSDENLARLVAGVAVAAGADVVICATEGRPFVDLVADAVGRIPVVVATTSEEMFEALTDAGRHPLRLPLRSSSRYSQLRHATSFAFRAGSVSEGALVVCATGPEEYEEGGPLLVVTEIEPSIGDLWVGDLVRLTDGIRPNVLESALAVACEVARAARRGRPIGAILVLGDSVKVLEGSRQLIPNPLHGHEQAKRMITDPENLDAVVELSKLDGAFVVRGDGFIQTAGAFLVSPSVEVSVPAGLGARHVAAASVTVRTSATALVVSSTDGKVRAFAGGRMVLQMDPDVSIDLAHPPR